MNEKLLAMVEKEVLGWPGVWKKRDEDGPGGVGVTGYRYGEPQIGHVHDDGHADFSFPREVRDGLLQSGKATPHPAFPNSRTIASYRIRSAEDLPGAIELFRMNYERVKEVMERKENAEFAARFEAEILGWPGVEKEVRADGIVGDGEAAIYTLGERHIGHIHHDGVADVPFPRAVHDELVSSGKAEPHRGGFPAVVSYRINGAEDVAGAIELFRMSYERAKSASERKAERQS